MVSGDKCCMRDCQRVEKSSRLATKLANRLPDLCDATLGACLLFVKLILGIIPFVLQIN